MTPAMLYALVALAVATLADIVTTKIGLRRGLSEKAWLMRWIMSWAGSGWWVVKIGLTAALAWGLVKLGDPRAVWIAAAGLGGVALWNLRLLVTD